MKRLNGKTAVVTGGGSGIGRGMCLAFAAEGMSVVVSDIQEDAAEAVAAEVRETGQKALAVCTDVAKRDSVRELADRSFAEFGTVHVLCNNAGVFTFKNMVDLTHDDWKWVIGVNLDGVVNGVTQFVPRLIAQGGEAHIVNTSSTAGLYPGGGVLSYVTAKYAVTGLTEHLRRDLAKIDIGVSLLCPGNVRTQIDHSGRNRPDELGGPEETPAEFLAARAHRTIPPNEPEEVGEWVVQAIKNNEEFIVMNPERRAAVAGRLDALLAAYERAQ
ncbi:MAG TPA: SDR family NAD(P)-dependent oxidoreductase [Dehalococcoidia bacterium]|nr:SDR family NAD(P)-dependent oxidoreductase [Dehalococcoidia bacterium]